MTITKTRDGKDMEIALEGRLDTVTSPDLDAELKALEGKIDSLTLDLANLSYISSAGLRVLLNAHKSLMNKGGLKLIHAGELVREVFDVTGFSDILTVE